jgi:hypothetical protein
MGGGFHCVTLDVRRRGALEHYCRGIRNEGEIPNWKK